MRLLTNNPKKIVGLEGYGLQVVERVPIEMPPTRRNRAYLETKRDSMGHLLTLAHAPAQRGTQALRGGKVGIAGPGAAAAKVARGRSARRKGRDGR